MTAEDGAFHALDGKWLRVMATFSSSFSESPNTPHVYAKKVCLFKTATSVERLTREIKALQRTQGHCLPSLPSLIEFADDYVLVSPFCDKNLRNILSDSALRRCEPCQCELICENVAAALAYLHDTEIVHGNIVPENILCSGSRQSFVLVNYDLGPKFATRPSSYAFYVPPEATPSMPADIFSFARVLLECACSALHIRLSKLHQTLLADDGLFAAPNPPTQTKVYAAFSLILRTIDPAMVKSVPPTLELFEKAFNITPSKRNKAKDFLQRSSAFAVYKPAHKRDVPEPSTKVEELRRLEQDLQMLQLTLESSLVSDIEKRESAKLMKQALHEYLDTLNLESDL